MENVHEPCGSRHQKSRGTQRSMGGKHVSLRGLRKLEIMNILFCDT